MCEAASFSEVRLGDIVEVLDSRRIPLSAEERACRPGPVPYYGANGQKGWVDRYLFDEPLILVAEDGGHFDEFSFRPIAYRVSGPSWVNNHAHVIRAIKGNSQNYLFWTLVHRDVRRYIAGGTRSKLTQGELREIELLLPPLPEQEKIAEILDTVDAAIRKTEAIIAKLKQVKQGLLHDLLTRGIDENGELRDPERHPEQFKDSQLGRIPREWEVVHLGSILEGIDSGWSPSCVEQPPPRGEWGVLKVSAVTSGEFLASESKTLPGHLRPRPGLEVREGDVILARANGVVKLVGVSAQVRKTPPKLMLSDKLLRLRPNASVDDSFLGFLMKSAPIRLQIERVLSGSSGQKNISQAQVRGLLSVIPPLREQGRCVDVLEASVGRNLSEKSWLQELRLLKQALMDDLLTGRVRVTPLLKESEP